MTSLSSNNGDLIVWDQLTARNVEFKYSPLDEHVSSDSFRYTGIPLPGRERASTVVAYGKKFNVKNEMLAISFFVEGRPCDSSAGKKLLREANKLVKNVLSKDYKPDNAVIMLKDPNNESVIEEVHIQHCVITDAKVVINTEGVLVRFHFIGLMGD